MKLKWDEVGTRYYEIGVDRGVLYPMNNSGEYEKGVAWSGLTAVNESPSGAEPTNIYADNIKYLALLSTEEFAATIEALMYPDEFAECDGSKQIAPGVYIGQQARKHFGFSYRSKIGNDTMGNKFSETLHIVYNATAKPSEKQRSTINETPDAPSMSWETSTTPVDVTDADPTAHLKIVKHEVSEAAWTAITEALWGTNSTDSRILTPDEVVAIINEHPIPATRTVTQTLSHATSSFTGTTISDGEAFEATITADTDYVIDTVTVSMGGTDISSTAWDSSTSKVSIASVSGDITITVTTTAG